MGEENIFGSNGAWLEGREGQLSRGRFLKLAAAGALGAAGLALGMPQGSHAAGVVPVPPLSMPTFASSSVRPGLYVIQSQLNGYVLDIKGGSTSPGTEVINYPLSSPLAPNQVWNITSDGYIISALNGYVLDVKGASTAAGASVIAYPKSSTPSNNQRWDISSDGYISSYHTAYVLDVKGANKAAGTPVITYPKSNPPQANQKWRLRAVTVS